MRTAKPAVPRKAAPRRRMAANRPAKPPADPAGEPKKTAPAPMLMAAPAPPAKPVPDSRSRWGWWVVLGTGVSLLAASAVLAHGSGLRGAELAIFDFINGWADSLRPYFLAATIAPESLWFGTAAVVIIFLLRMYRAAWQLAAITVVGYGAAFAGKLLIDRGRPTELLTDAHVRVHETGGGYPSAHVMMITIIVLTLWPYLPRGWRWLTVLPIIAMALSRIYLGVHSPLDVVGGCALGAALVGATRVLPAAWRAVCRFY